MALSDSIQKHIDAYVANIDDATVRNNINTAWDAISAEGTYAASGADSIYRPVFVNLQAIIEQNIANALQSGKILGAVGVIHTPTPATPLRADDINIQKGLVTEAIANDPNRLKTVEKRPAIIRKFLNEGGLLIAAYPESALEKDIVGIDNFNNIAAQYDNLLDRPVQSFPADKTGATYVVAEADGSLTAFSLQAYQSNQPATERSWGMWFGDIKQEKIADRINDIEDYLKSENIDLEKEIANHIQLNNSKSNSI